MTRGPLGFGDCDGLGDPDGDPEGVGDGVGVGVGVGVGDGDGDGLADSPGFGDGGGVGKLKTTIHVNPEDSGHCNPFGASAKAYVTEAPGGIFGAAVGVGDGVGCPGSCCWPFIGGVTPPGAAVPLAKFPEHAARASVPTAKHSAVRR